MTDQTPTTTGEDVPEFLKREPKASATKPVVNAGTATEAPTTPAKPVSKKAAKRAAKAAAKAAGAAKTPTAPKTHKPSNIERTEANPARSIVPAKFKAKYAAHDNSNGDEIAYAVKSFIYTRNDEGREALDLKALKQLADDNGIDFKAYEGLNNGQKSMNVRNRLRGILKSGKTITVGKRKFADSAKALTVRPVAEAAA